MTGLRQRWLSPFLIAVLLTAPCLAANVAVPDIHLDESVRRHPVVFQGQPISSTFTVRNQGKEELQIFSVSPS